MTSAPRARKSELTARLAPRSCHDDSFSKKRRTFEQLSSFRSETTSPKRHAGASKSTRAHALRIVAKCRRWSSAERWPQRTSRPADQGTCPRQHFPCDRLNRSRHEHHLVPPSLPVHHSQCISDSRRIFMAGEKTYMRVCRRCVTRNSA